MRLPLLGIAAGVMLAGSAALVPAVFAVGGPGLAADPVDPRRGERVALSGSGWGGPSGCEVRWDDLAATRPECSIDDQSALSGALVVPADATLGRHFVSVCAPSCLRGSKAGVIVTVRPAVTTVPDLSGQTYDEVLASLAAQGLNLDESVTRPDDARAIVDTQTPEPETEVERESSVGVTFAVPPEPDQVVVPDLSGLSLAASRRVVRALALELAVDPDGDGRGRVASQVPVAGTSVEPATVVTVTLQASGTTLVVVPDVVGLDVDEAERVIEQSGLIMRASSTEDGRVQTQNPVAGSTVPAGSVVGVALSSEGLPGWVLVGALALAALLLGGLLSHVATRSRRHGRRWVDEHVRVVPAGRSPSYDVASAGPSHSVKLAPHPTAPVTELEEVMK